MTRSRASAKSAGTSFETLVAAFLHAAVDDRIERRAKNGALDRGDLSGVRTFRNGRVVVQCKDYGGQFKVGAWLGQVDKQRGTDDAVAGVVVAKRRGTRDPGDQVVMMTLADFAALLTGERPSDSDSRPLVARESHETPLSGSGALGGTQNG